MNTFKKCLLATVVAFSAASFGNAAIIVEQEQASVGAAYYTFGNAENWVNLESVQALGITEQNVNQRYICNRTPLMFACQHNAPTEVIQHLLDLGATKELREQDGFSAVDIASEQGNFDIVKCLLNNGAAAEWTSVRFACRSGSLDIVKILHEKRADLFYYDSSCSLPSAVHDACVGGNLDLVRYLVDNNVLNMVLQIEVNGADSPLHVASAYGHVNIVQYFIDDMHFIVDAKGWNGETALIKACHASVFVSDERRLAVIKFLLQRDAAVNFIPEHKSASREFVKGRTAFANVASGLTNPAFAILLARHGADIGVPLNTDHPELAISRYTEEDQVAIRTAADVCKTAHA